MTEVINATSGISAICDGDFCADRGFRDLFTLLDMEHLAAIQDQESEIKKAAHQGAE